MFRRFSRCIPARADFLAGGRSRARSAPSRSAPPARPIRPIIWGLSTCPILTAPAAGRSADVCAWDRIRSGAITLASATPDGPKVLTVNDLVRLQEWAACRHVVRERCPICPHFSPRPPPGRVSGGGVDGSRPSCRSQSAGFIRAVAAQSRRCWTQSEPPVSLAASLNFGGGVAIRPGDGDGCVSLGLTSFETAANKINGIVVLADNKATIQSFGGQSSKGGTFALTGRWRFIGGR